MRKGKERGHPRLPGFGFQSFTEPQVQGRPLPHVIPHQHHSLSNPRMFTLYYLVYTSRTAVPAGKHDQVGPGTRRQREMHPWVRIPPISCRSIVGRSATSNHSRRVYLISLRRHQRRVFTFQQLLLEQRVGA